MKTLIAIPCGKTVDVPFFLSLMRMKKVGEVEILPLENCLVYSARNMLATYAVNNGFDYILWLDSDMVFEADLMERMFASIGDKQYLTGLCFGRRPNYSPCICKHMDIEKTPMGNKPINEIYLDYPRNSVFEIDGSGFACVLQKVEMLDVMLSVYGNPFMPNEGFGEDYMFCYRAKSIGYQMFCDSSIKIGHLAGMVVDEDFHDDYLLSTASEET